jgi:UDP-glucose:(heptosyl)LPS alpha-1,3-glucosyltransferase
MKVGLVIQNFDPRLGGAEQWTFQFARMLCQSGLEVHVAARRFGAQADELPIVRQHVTAAGTREDFAHDAADKLRTLSLDVVHDMGAGWYCDLFQPHGGTRAANHRQNLLTCRPWFRPFKRAFAGWLPRYRRFNRLASRQYVDDGRTFLALSKMVADDFQRYHRVPAERIRIVYNGVDLARFSPQGRQRHRAAVRQRLGVRDDEVLLLIVAHNFKLKGVATLIRAVGRLLAEGAPVKLAVAGGKRFKAYARLAERCGAASAVSFVGPVDDSSPYYAAADVYVQPTFYDPCSLVVLEALACGLPVVTSRFNGVSELMTDGVNGAILGDPSDAGELAAKLRPLLDANRRHAWGAAARQLAMRHSLERNCREVQAIYSEIIGQRGRQAA